MRRPCLQFVDDNDKFLEEIKLSTQVRPQLEDDSQVVPFHKREPGKHANLTVCCIRCPFARTSWQRR